MAASLVPTEGGSPIVLDKPIVLIGRHQDCDVSLEASSKVSRRHCCIVQVGERYVLRDLGSMNGIRVNGHRLIETELCPGDEVAVADVCFIFHRDDAPAERPDQRAAAKRPAAAKPPAHGDSSQYPVALPDEDPPDNLPPVIPIEDDGDLRLKDDSHTERGFVHA